MSWNYDPNCVWLSFDQLFFRALSLAHFLSLWWPEKAWTKNHNRLYYSNFRQFVRIHTNANIYWVFSHPHTPVSFHLALFFPFLFLFIYSNNIDYVVELILYTGSRIKFVTIQAKWRFVHFCASSLFLLELIVPVHYTIPHIERIYFHFPSFAVRKLWIVHLFNNYKCFVSLCHAVLFLRFIRSDCRLNFFPPFLFFPLSLTFPACMCVRCRSHFIVRTIRFNSISSIRFFISNSLYLCRRSVKTIDWKYTHLWLLSLANS